MTPAYRRYSLWLSLLVLVGLFLSACAPAAAPAPTQAPTQAPAQAPTQDPTQAPPPATVPPPAPTSAPDYLSDILQRGTLVVSTDPAYPPQSELVENTSRPADTKCGRSASAKSSPDDAGRNRCTVR
jgi:hypothetical protein